MPPTSELDTRAIVEAFVNAINSGRAEKVVERMTQDAVFIDTLGHRIEGKRALLEAWRSYYQLFPDYRIEVEGMIIEDQEAMLRGWAGGTLRRGGRAVEGGAWRIPAAWRATTDGARRLTLWQVFADNKPVYALLGQ